MSSTVNLKKCLKCNIEKALDCFHKRRSNKDGLYSYCKKCKSNDDKLYRENNLEIKKARDKKYYTENKEKHNKKTLEYYYKNREEIRLNHKEYYQNNKNKIYTHIKNKKKIDPLYKLTCNIRSRISSIIYNKKLQKNNKFKEYIGCSLDELKYHLESQFIDDMSWENHGKFGWHVDHIIPLSSAKTEEELYKLCHYTNLQPLWAEDNLKKSNKNVIDG